MTLDLKLCAELLELDGKRTPGNWIADDFCEQDGEVRRLGTSDGSDLYYHRTATLAYFEIEPADPDCPDMPVVSEPRRKFNCQFAAAAPKLAAQLKAALQERERLLSGNRKLHDALHAARCFVDHYYDYQHPQGNEEVLALVDEALSETEATR